MHRIHLIFLLTCLTVLPSLGQTPGKNYVMTETMLNSSGTRKIVAVQYYDGLGRPSELAEGGISGSGSYLHSLQTYDALGRETVTTLPGASSSTPDFKGLTPTSTSLASSYGGDTRPYSQTTYDALGRPVFISTPGQNWTGRGKRIEYITNGENEVRRYSAGANAPTLSGYYPIGSLKAERVTDEDGISVSTYKDLMGRVVLERRGNNDDTYYVYDAKGLLRFVLQPMYQESPNFKNRFQYTYDSRGRMTNKYLPGCDPIKYYYDGANRMIALQEPSRGDTVCTRHFFYDGLGRMVVQARSFATPSNSSKKLITTRTAGQNAVEIAHTGYYIKNYNIPASLQVEIVNYYDDYGFLTSGIFTDSIPSGNFQATSSVCTTTLKTGDITATSDGHLLARVYYYDDKGSVIDTRENLLDGRFLQTTTSYSFTDKPLTQQTTVSGSSNWNIPVTESFTYNDYTDMPTAHSITYNNSATTVATCLYDDFGRLATKINGYWYLATSYSYNIHGWLTSLGTVNIDNNYQHVFSQDIYYETGSGQHCYNGNISSMRWKTGAGDTGRGYKFIYDMRNRMTQANHTFFDMSDYPISNSERVTYNRNSAPLTLTRMGGATGLVLDSLAYTYNGNQVKKISDVSSHTVTNGLFEFVDGANKVTEYKYNDAGDLVWDYNKGIVSIKYDYLGHPVRIQFSNRSLVEYVYAADGRKLREKHTTAVEGLHMNFGQTFNLLPSQILSTDSMDYAGNIRYRWQNLHNVGDVYNFWYHFDDGYLAVMPVQTSPTAYHYIPSYHYQVRDHQGNIRVVVDEVGNLEQKNEYFAYGGPWVSSTNQGFQPFKYNNKELDRMHGLDWYDYGARRYDPACCLFTQIDPLAEKYPHLNPYAYCAGNPVRYVDPDGRHVRVTRNEDGSYKVVEGGIVDGDLNIYDVTDGWDNRVSIGEALTQFSFFDDNEKPSVGSVIDLNDQSGQEFWDNFNTWAPIMPLPYYAYHARNGQKYDFKSQGEPYPVADKDNKEQINANNKYHNRGMKFNVDGKEFIASARDIGNYAAGYVAGLSGLSWQEARCGFDLYESYKRGRFTVEAGPTQSAQFKGYLYGLKPIGLTRRIIRKAFIR